MWAKSTAALCLGLPLAMVLVSLYAFFGAGTSVDRTLPSLLLFVPVWVGSASAAFAFRRGWQAWAWMGGAVVLGFAVLHVAKATHWVVL